jgi:IclR family acetate operon transcriptional repressor
VHMLVVPSPHPVQHVTEAGSSAPAHATGLGKALLAHLGPRELDRVLGHGPLARFTDSTMCERADLEAELRLTAKRGFAIDNEEGVAGLKCVAAYVDSPVLGPVAVSVSGPASDFTQAAHALEQSADDLRGQRPPRRAPGRRRPAAAPPT